jgi:ERCC4-type nuclease
MIPVGVFFSSSFFEHDPGFHTSSMPTSFNFPALRSLGDLADQAPTILIDSREQLPLVFQRLPSRVAALGSGDYSIAGLETAFAIERKTVSDLVSCCCGSNRQRFEKELFRLKSYHFKRLLVIGSRGEIEVQRYHSKISAKSVLGSLAAWECRYNIPIVYSATTTEAALEVERWCWYYCKEYVETVNDLWRATREVT